MKSNYSYAQYLFKLLIHGRTLSLDRIEFKFIWAFFIKQCLQKTLTWFYSIRYTIDLHSNSLFVEILHPILYPLIFNIEILFSFESERQIWKKKKQTQTVELIVFIWVGSRILWTPHGSYTREKQTISNACAYCAYFSYKTCHIDLKKIEEKKNGMKWERVHRNKVTDQGYQWYKRHWMSLTFSTLLVVLKKKVETVGNYVTK